MRVLLNGCCDGTQTWGHTQYTRAYVPPTHHSIDRQAILVVHESMARVNNCPLPYPFLCILHISTFLFIYR